MLSQEQPSARCRSIVAIKAGLAPVKLRWSPLGETHHAERTKRGGDESHEDRPSA
jgi:hypothetical protein